MPGPVARRLREEAERLGMTSEEYLVELVTQGLDPRSRSVEYVKSAEELLEEAKGELSEVTLGRQRRRCGARRH